MSKPTRFLVRMGIFLLLVGAGCFALAPRLSEAFFANTILNGMILGVLLLGVIHIFRQVFTLTPEIQWIEKFKQESSGRLVFPGALSEERPPRLLAPMATMLRDRQGSLSLSTTSI